jgi:exodeoxyribonuclease-3
VVKNIPVFDDDMARVIAGTVLPEGTSYGATGVRVIGAYFPNGQEPGSEKFEYKMEWLKGSAPMGQERTGSTPQTGADGRLQHHL